MKNLLILFALIFGSQLNAQNHKMELNDSGKFEFVVVCDSLDLNSKEIYEKTNDWIAYTFRNKEHVTQSNVENKMIRLKGISAGAIPGPLGFIYDLGYMIQIDIKENKARLRIYDMDIVTPTEKISLERNFLKPNGKIRTAGVYTRMIDGVNLELNQIHESLILSYKTELGSNDDW